jgi:hypothetical protein
MHMSTPTDYKQSVTVPLPSDEVIRKVVGEDYNPDTTLNVIKMFRRSGGIFIPC